MADIKATFIPKKPLTQERKKKKTPLTSFVIFVSLIIFLATLSLWGGIYFYNVLLDRNMQQASESVERAKEAIDPELIVNLDRANKRIDTTQALLDSHVVISPVFDLLEELTLPAVRFERFDYRSAQGNRDGITLTLTGETRDYSTLALQSSLFGESEFIQDPLFSDLRLNQFGNVAFTFQATINPRLVLFRDNLDELLQQQEDFEGESQTESVGSDGELEDPDLLLP